ncbi:MAG: glycine zipper 2TM domain-containing protein [Psychromonas sp.]|nr:glycine zipper 2TM domain-containing protein [Psychromonas sp.]
MKTYYITPILLFALCLFIGCASNPYGDTYALGDTQKIQNVSYGVIIRTEPVNIEGEGSSVGTFAGAAAGGILGSNVGGGSGSQIAAIAGGLLGGVAGNKTAKSITKRNGVNLSIKLDSGNIIAVVQEVNPDMLFQVGQRVQVNIQGNTARVVPIE